MSDILEEAKERAAFYRDYTRLGARFDPDTGTEAADLIDRLSAELAKDYYKRHAEAERHRATRNRNWKRRMKSMWKVLPKAGAA